MCEISIEDFDKALLKLGRLRVHTPRAKKRLGTGRSLLSRQRFAVMSRLTKRDQCPTTIVTVSPGRLCSFTTKRTTKVVGVREDRSD